jgi:UDP-N-acetylglucosamine 2-epimerase (non-hydrolysing)
MKPRISVVGAARPNFVKVAPLLRALESWSLVDFVHTGQHYDWEMSGRFLEDLELRDPDLNLEVGSGSHGEQTAGVLVAYERHLMKARPDAVVVVGDVNSTLAAALAASKLEIPVAHVEAGLRSRDWSMPEEINRILTDRLSTWLFTTSRDADENLIAEGAPRGSIHLVGNVMIDSLSRLLPAARQNFPDVRNQLGLPHRYAVLTLHRPSNVDGETLVSLADCLNEIAGEIPIVFPIHPRTKTRLEELGLLLEDSITALAPLGYVDFLGLLDSASIALTDSGGIQEETSVLGVPCITMRDTTERPVTCELGTNTVVGSDPEAILKATNEALNRRWEPAKIPFWDGNAAPRIAEILLTDLIV